MSFRPGGPGYFDHYAVYDQPTLIGNGTTSICKDSGSNDSMPIVNCHETPSIEPI